MKKVKFTLGLALSMLFIGANVNAAYVNSAKHEGWIKTTVSVKASAVYTGDQVTFGAYKVGQADPIPTLSSYNASTGSVDITQKDIVVTMADTWKYGQKSEVTSLFGYEANDVTVYNRLKVQLKYTNGNEFMPVVRRTITLGRWDHNGKTGNASQNSLTSVKTVITDFLVADSSFFNPYLDRKSGVATYVYRDEILPLIEKYIIYSIDYEISVHDEVGTPGVGDYGPPVYTDRTDMRGLTIEAEDGIGTDPNVAGTGGIIYVPSQKDFVFKAFSDKEIVVSTTRGLDDKGGVKIKKEVGFYQITIAKVQSNFKITIKSVETESGIGGDYGDESGNTTVSVDAVTGSSGILNVKTATAGAVSVYTITGQLYKIESVPAGSYSWSMPKGIYIVRLNNKAYKVVL